MRWTSLKAFPELPALHATNATVPILGKNSSLPTPQGDVEEGWLARLHLPICQGGTVPTRQARCYFR